MASAPDFRMQDLLAEGDFVRSLARHLIGTADADDLVQETWMTALRRPPVGLQQTQSWLAQVVRRLAANRRRGDRRRERRESECARTRPAQSPSTADIVAREQVRQRVVAAVLALDEPFRATVVARFFECQTNEAIAARTHVPVATVRSRLKRGLDRLRARLDAEHGGRAAWTVPLAPLARTPVSAATPAVSAATSIAKKALAAAVLLLAAFSLWGARSDADSQRAASPIIALGRPGRGDAARQQPRADEARRVALDGTAPRRRPPRERMPYPSVDEPTHEVTVRVLDAETRLPVAGAELRYLPVRVDVLHPQTRGDRELHEMAGADSFLERFGSRTESDPDGLAKVELPRSGGAVIASHGDRSARRSIRPADVPAAARITLWLEDERWIWIRLVDPSGRVPVRGALIEVASVGIGPIVPESCAYGGTAGPSDAGGRIRVPWRRDRESIRVRPWTVGRSEWLRLELTDAIDRVTELRYPATGSMTIELRTPADRLWPGQIEARVQPMAERAAGSPIAGPVTWQNSEPGIHRIPHVEVGATYRSAPLLSAASARRRARWSPGQRTKVKTCASSCARRLSRARCGRPCASGTGRRRRRDSWFTSCTTWAHAATRGPSASPTRTAASVGRSCRDRRPRAASDSSTHGRRTRSASKASGSSVRLRRPVSTTSAPSRCTNPLS